MESHGSLQSLLHRRVAEVIDANHLAKRLESGEKLRVKLGVDPNKPDLHIGHAIPLRKLKEFQDAGHTAVLILGDYTAQLGDPSDRSDARKLVSADETKANAQAFLMQVFKILDPAKTEMRRNSEWFNTFDLRKTIELMSSVTLNQLLAHETFAKRLTPGQSLHFHEPLYSLMQGYDSVMVKADVELGGVDQKFNLLMGRTMQRVYKQPEQDIMLVDYLPGTDGSAKMSKSVGNTINLTDSADEMFGKVMSMPDSVMPAYFELGTDLPAEEIEAIKRRLESGHENPRDSKVMLAKEIVTMYHSHDAAEKAEEQFERTFRQKETPEDVQTVILKKNESDTLVNLLVSRSSLCASKSEARRLIEQGGVTIDGQKVIREGSDDGLVMYDNKPEIVIKVGPRRWLKVVWK